MSLWTSKAHQLRHAQATLLADIIRNINPDNPEHERTYTTTLAGDERALRGIPVVGAKGVSGTMRGLRPGDSARHAAASATDLPRQRA